MTSLGATSASSGRQRQSPGNRHTRRAIVARFIGEPLDAAENSS